MVMNSMHDNDGIVWLVGFCGTRVRPRLHANIANHEGVSYLLTLLQYPIKLKINDYH